MNQFVADCRGEWKRLAVPDAVVVEMAAELTADLEEAAAEGASAEDVLGDASSDARAFAAAWAAERGVIPRPLPGRNGRLRTSRVLAAVGGASALTAIVGAVLMVLAPSATLALEARLDPPPRAISAVRGIAVSPDGTMLAVARPDGLLLFNGRTQAKIWAVPTARRISAPAPPPIAVRAATSAPIVAVDVDDSGVDVGTVGLVLLAVGLAGLVSATMFWLMVQSPSSR